MYCMHTHLHAVDRGHTRVRDWCEFASSPAILLNTISLRTAAWSCCWISRSLQISRNVLVSLSLYTHPLSAIFSHYKTVSRKPGAVSLNQFQNVFKMFWNRFKCACECAKPVSCGHVKLIVFACMNFIICITARFRTHASWWQNRLAWRTTVVTACVAVIRGLTVEGQGYCPSNVFSDWWAMPICITLSSYLSSPTDLSCSPMLHPLFAERKGVPEATRRFPEL